MFLFCSELCDGFLCSFCEKKRLDKWEKERKRYITRSCYSQMEIDIIQHNTLQKQNKKKINVYKCISFFCMWNTIQWLFTLARFESSFRSLCARVARLFRARVQSFGMWYASAFGYGANLTERTTETTERCRIVRAHVSSALKSSKASHRSSYNKNKHAIDKSDQRINNNTAETYIRSDFCTTFGANYYISVCDSVNIAFKWHFNKEQLKRKKITFFF